MWLKFFVGTAAAVLSVGFALGYWIKSGTRQAPKGAAASCSIACTLGGEELDARRQVLAAFRGRARNVRELADGYALRFGFDAATLADATGLIADESRCCGFLDFRLTARPSDDYLSLEVTGPPGTKELLGGTLGHGASHPPRQPAAAPQAVCEAACCAAVAEDEPQEPSPGETAP